MNKRQIPNAITILRILLVIPIMVLLARREYGAVLVLFFVAGLSDALDGYLARRFCWLTRLGSILDPLADKFMLVGTYLILGWNGLLAWWLVGLVILRDVVIVGGATTYHYFCQSLTMEPTRISKLNTVLQILLGLMIIVVAMGPWIPAWSLTLMIALVAISTVWSGVDYVWRWGWRAYRCYYSGRGE